MVGCSGHPLHHLSLLCTHPDVHFLQAKYIKPPFQQGIQSHILSSSCSFLLLLPPLSPSSIIQAQSAFSRTTDLAFWLSHSKMRRLVNWDGPDTPFTTERETISKGLALVGEVGEDTPVFLPPMIFLHSFPSPGASPVPQSFKTLKAADPRAPNQKCLLNITYFLPLDPSKGSPEPSFCKGRLRKGDATQ